jgi:adenylate cyclase
MKTSTDQNIFSSKIKKLFGKSTDYYHRNIGEVLRQGNIITEEQLQHALKVQKEKLYTHGKAVRLGQIIVGLGYASEKELVKAIKENYDITIK